MKLIGYLHLEGERDGKKYDDYRLYVEKDNIRPTADAGGSQIMQIRTQYGSFFPKVSAQKFNDLVKSGLKIGSEIRMYKDAGDNSLIVELM